MKNLKKLSREELRNVNGGKSCSLTVKQKDGSYRTYAGTCATTVDSQEFIATSNGVRVQFTTHQYCEAGFGETALSSNGGRSRCN